jgi:ABC-2 type transport system ATP-binding protein
MKGGSGMGLEDNRPIFDAPVRDSLCGKLTDRPPSSKNGLTVESSGPPGLIMSIEAANAGLESEPAPGADPVVVIRIEGLEVSYPARGFRQRPTLAVKGLDLEIRQGEVFGFLGPNGAGKTSTLQVLLGFQPATRGAAFIYGVDVRQPIARQRIGYLPELTYYYKFLSAEELLRFYGRIFKIPRLILETRIDAVLKLVELEPVRRRLIKTYSKGMQQRIGLAQALINQPDLLILDEPTSGLDPLGRMKVREIIQRLKDEGKTVLFSSHELGEVETVCDRVAIIQSGELKVVGRVDDLVKEYEMDLERVFLRIIGYQPQTAP